MKGTHFSGNLQKNVPHLKARDISAASLVCARRCRFRTYGLLRNLVVSPILTTIQSNKKRAPKRVLFFITGAADKNRTYDPVITNDVLYH